MNSITVPDSDLDLYQRGRACPIWRGYYNISLATGVVEVIGTPTQWIFETAWTQLCHLKDVLPRILGNLMAHAKGAEWGGPEYVTALMEMPGVGRQRSTLYQYHSTYARLPTENQRPGVKYSYDREVARLPVEQQPAVLDRIERGDFENSDQLAAAVRQMKREPTPPTYRTQDAPIPCPFCESNGWDRERLHWSECPHCGAHGDEVMDNYRRLLTASLHLYHTGDRADFDAAIQPWTCTAVQVQEEDA